MNSFKECMSLFTTGVVVITTQDMRGITINSFCSLSLKPMMILFNLEKAARSFKWFCSCEKFTVNILSDGQLEVSRAFSASEKMDWKQYFGIVGDLYVIKESLCYIHCVKHKVYDGGDHEIIIGRVASMHVNSKKKPLVYYKSQYCGLI